MKIKDSLTDWKAWAASLAYVLVFLMLVFPDVPQLSYVKVSLFGAIIVIVGIHVLLTGRSGLHFSVFALTILLSLMSFLFVLEGFYAGTPGAFRSAQIYVVWPILYLVVIGGLRSKRIVLGLTGIMVFSTICISIYSIVFMLIQTGVMPENRYFDLVSFDWRVQAFGLHDYIAMGFPGMSSLPFLVPFSVAALVTFHPELVRRVWLWIAVALSLVCVLISGRRALYLVTLGSPLVTLLFIRFQPEAEQRLSKKALVRVAAFGVLALAISLGSLNAVFGVTLSGMADRLSVGFDFSPTSEDTGATDRRTQYRALLAGWMDNPLLGAGHGAPAFGSIRSEESPWNYELHYLALLYQTGLLGFTAYAASICWIFWMGVRVIRSGGYLSALMAASLVGMSSILVADATNPYLARYDAMWSIFLPIALINFWLMRGPSLTQSASV